MRIYCSAPCPGGSLPTGGCKQLVKREGDRCPLHGGGKRKLSLEMRQELLKSEDALRIGVREDIMVARAYDLGVQHDLDLSEIALLLFPILHEEIKALRKQRLDDYMNKIPDRVVRL